MADRDYTVRLVVSGAGAKSELQSFTVKGDEAAASMRRVAKSYEDTQAKVDPVFKALLTQQREVEKATKAAADAVRLYGISQDQANAQIRKTSEYYGAQVIKLREAAVAQSMLGKAMTGVSGQLVALSAGAGPVGTFLSALGPWGVAAAAGVGLVSAAFAEARRTAELLAKEADTLTNASEVTGFSTDQLQALTIEAAKHGVSMEQASTAVVKFTTAWADARDGGGDMLKKLREIDPALAEQIQRTKDSATAFDLLLKAINKADQAGDIAARNSLSRAAGGRGGAAAFTGIAAAVGTAGGLDPLTKGADDAGNIIDKKLLVQIDNLKDELDETKKRADLLFGAMGAKPLLEADLAWQKMRVSIARTAIEMENVNKNVPDWQKMMGVGAPWSGNDPESIFRREEIAKKKNADNFNIPQPEYPPKIGGFPVVIPPKDAKAELADMKERLILMGTGATEADRLKVKLKELDVALKGNVTTENEHAAAIGRSAAQTDAYITTINLRNSALGTAASVEDVVTAKMAALANQQQQGAGLTDKEVESQRRIATEQANGTAAILGQVDAQRIAAATTGLSTGAAAALSAKLQLLYQDERNGVTASEATTAAREKATAALGAQAQAAAKASMASQLKFDRETVWLSDKDVQIAQQLRGIYGDDIPAALNSSEAAVIRMTASLKNIKNVKEQKQFKATLVLQSADQKKETNCEQRSRSKAA